MHNNPLEPIRVLAKRLSEVAAKLGLELHQVAIIPGPSGDNGEHMPDVMQVMFKISDEAVDPKGYEQRKMDEKFAEMTKQFAITEQAQKLEKKKPEIQADVEKWLKGDK